MQDPIKMRRDYWRGLSGKEKAQAIKSSRQLIAHLGVKGPSILLDRARGELDNMLRDYK